MGLRPTADHTAKAPPSTLDESNVSVEFAVARAANLTTDAFRWRATAEAFGLTRAGYVTNTQRGDGEGVGSLDALSRSQQGWPVRGIATQGMSVVR